jgi:hypothetical protein
MSRSLRESSLLNTTDYRSLSVGSVPTSEYLITTTVLTQNEPSVTFDVSAFNGVYKHLQICMVARSDDAGSSNLRDLRIQVNADTGASYSSHVLRGDGAGIYSNATSSQTSINTALALLPRPSNPSTQYGAAIIDVLDAFETTKYTTIRMLGGAKPDGEDQVWLGSGLWQNTSALTEIKIFANVGNLAAGSRFSLYGVTA